MKKLGIAAIICFFIFLSFAIIGGICLGVGIANVAVDSNFTEIVQTYGDDLDSILEGAQDYAEYSGSESFELDENCQAIELVGFSGNVTVKSYSPEQADNYTVLIEYDGLFDLPSAGEQHFSFSSNGHTLTISPLNDLIGNFSIGVVNLPSGGDITIYLPQYNSLDAPLELDLTISDTVGEVRINEFIFGNIILSDTVGEIKLEDIKADTITCEDTIGEIHADGDFRGIIVTDTIGECHIESDTVLTIDSKIEGNIAEVNVSLPEQSRINFTTSDTIGNISIDNELKDNNSSIMFNISGSIGNVSIEAD